MPLYAVTDWRIPKRFEEFPPFSDLARHSPVMACRVHIASWAGCKRDFCGKKRPSDTVGLDDGLNPLNPL